MKLESIERDGADLLLVIRAEGAGSLMPESQPDVLAELRSLGETVRLLQEDVAASLTLSPHEPPKLPVDGVDLPPPKVRPKVKRKQLEDAPPSWLPLAVWAKKHGLPKGTVYSAVTDGRLPARKFRRPDRQTLTMWFIRESETWPGRK